MNEPSLDDSVKKKWIRKEANIKAFIKSGRIFRIMTVRHWGTKQLLYFQNGAMSENVVGR